MRDSPLIFDKRIFERVMKHTERRTHRARALASALNFVRQKACRNVAIEQKKNIVKN